MLNAFVSIISLILLTANGLTALRQHERRVLAFLLPSIVITGLLIVVETMLFYYPDRIHSYLKLLVILQVLVCPAWLVFTMLYARRPSFSELSGLDKLILALSAMPVIAALLLPASNFYYYPDFRMERVLFLEPKSFYFYLAETIILLVALGNLENTLRNSMHSEQWRIKLAILGSGAVIVSLLLFLSQGLITKAVNMGNLPMRNAGLCVGLSFMLYAEWRRKSARVVISRKIAYRSVAVAVAGIYLLGLGLARAGIQQFGGGFSKMLMVTAIALLTLGTLLLLLSNTVRRKLSIWAQRHLYDEKYDYRGQWMAFSERLSKATDSAALIRAALLSFCETFGRTGAYYIPVDHESASGLGGGVHYEVDENAARSVQSADYASLLDLPGTPVLIEENGADLMPSGLREKLRLMNISLFMPVKAADEPEGIIFLGLPIDGREKYDIEDYELMEAMSRQFGLCARSFRLSDQLATAREMEALGKLGAFVLHDLKNQVYAMSLLTDNAKKFIAEPEFQKDMLETLGNTVANMKILITQLTHLPSAANMRIESMDLLELAAKACAKVPGANVKVRGEHVLVPVDAEQISKVFINLCLNAVEAGHEKPILVEVLQEDVPLFRIHDQGGGIPEEVLRKGLFKPFNTTKQLGMGIGLYHSRKIAEAHNARIDVSNRPGEGCTFCVRFEGLAAKADPVPADRREQGGLYA